jgi:xylan 1,4-beta-xylosidase
MNRRTSMVICPALISFKPTPLNHAKPQIAWPVSLLLLLIVMVQCLNAAPEKNFTNPILPGFHADPSICRVGDDYYMVHSTFEYFPGVPIFQSKDLVNWKQIGHVLTRKSQLNLERRQASQGIFAPTIRHHNGTFYMITTHVGGNGNFYVTATNAAGPWSEPVWLDRAGIDPSLFFDTDGKVYYTRQVDGERGYSGQQLLNLETGKLEGEIKELWRGTGGVWPEGPHLYKVNGKYYLMISEGGTSYDHMITVARSDSPWGPFAPNPKNPILTHRHLPDHPFQALGHGDLVETDEGWWVVFLGFRPQGGKFHHLGRETFLAPVTWENGWPEINGGKPISATLLAPKLKPHSWPKETARDEFDASTLSLHWNYVRNPNEADYSLTAKPGALRLHGAAATLNDLASPTFIGRRQTAFNCRAATKISFTPGAANEEAGLVLRGNDQNHCQIVIAQRDGKRQVALRQTSAGKIVTPEVFYDVPDGDLILSVTALPLEYNFAVQTAAGKTIQLGTARTRELSTETLTAQPRANFNFTGVYIGLFATGNGQRSTASANFDWFEYQSLAP